MGQFNNIVPWLLDVCVHVLTSVTHGGLNPAGPITALERSHCCVATLQTEVRGGIVVSGHADMRPMDFVSSHIDESPGDICQIIYPMGSQTFITAGINGDTDKGLISV